MSRVFNTIRIFAQIHPSVLCNVYTCKKSELNAVMVAVEEAFAIEMRIV